MSLLALLLLISTPPAEAAYQPRGAHLLTGEINQMVAGTDFTCVFTASAAPGASRLRDCWGDEKNYWLPYQRLKDATEISASEEEFCERDGRGEFACSRSGRSYRYLAPLKDVHSVAIGAFYACGIAGEAVKCIVEGRDGFVTDSGVPRLGHPHSLVVGDHFGCAIDGGKVSCWTPLNPYYAHLQVPVMQAPRELAAKGDRFCAIDGDAVKCGGFKKYASPAPALKNPRRLSISDGTACVIDDEGVKCWGESEAITQNIPHFRNPRLLAVGTAHACGVDDDGLKCWGWNRDGSMTPPPAVFGRASLAAPSFNLDGLASFFETVTLVSGPAKAKFFGALAQYANREWPSRKRDLPSSADRFFLATLAAPALEGADSKFVQEELLPVYRDCLQDFERELEQKPQNASIALEVTAIALESLRDFLSAAEYASLASLQRTIGAALADPGNQEKIGAVRDGIRVNAALLEKLTANPHSKFLVAAVRAAEKSL